MLERIQPAAAPASPAPVLTEPSYTAQTLLVAARVLEMQPGAAMNTTVLVRTRAAALDAITGTLPSPVRTSVREQLYNAMPSWEGTHGIYAGRLREIAKTV